MSVGSTYEFSKWRQRLWPVYTTELKAFLPLFFLKFCVSFNYTILAATKDTIVVTAKGGGAEVIPVLKGGVVLIFAFLAMLIYSKLSNKLSRTGLFYAITTPFLLFFLLYGTVLFPYREVLSPQKSASWLLSYVGMAHKHWISVYSYWMNSLFFVLSELWGGMMINVLFWGFANQITSVKDAARFYTLYTAGGHIGTVTAGVITYNIANLQDRNFELIVFNLMNIVVLVGIFIIAIYWWTNRYVVHRPGFVLNLPDKDLKDGRTKLSLKDSLVFIISSPYLGLIALMVIGYGLSINMVEVTWKAILKLQFPNSNDYQAYMGIVQTILGMVSLFIAIFVGGNVIRRYGWYASAQLTPLILGVTSFLFFMFYFTCPKYLMLLVFCGTLHNVACKTMKYCLFDTTKEMAYIPLDREAKIKGKAAVDLVGARFGKSGASWTQLALIDFVGAGSILGIVPLLVPCLLCVIAFWFFAVHKLNKRFVKLQTQIGLVTDM